MEGPVNDEHFKLSTSCSETILFHLFSWYLVAGQNQRISYVAMKLSRIFYIISMWNIMTVAFCAEQLVNQSQSVDDESTVLANIVTNLLIKYFEDDHIYLSIIPSFRNEESYFLDDFIFRLFENCTIKELSHSILQKLDDSVRYKHSFYLIFISNNESLA